MGTLGLLAAGTLIEDGASGAGIVLLIGAATGQLVGMLVEERAVSGAAIVLLSVFIEAVMGQAGSICFIVMSISYRMRFENTSAHV